MDDVQLYFDVEGSGLEAQGNVMVARPTLVLLHGGPGVDHSFFKPEFSTMAEVAQVVYLDQRGSGRSDRGDPSSWTWSRWAEDVADFCRALDIDSPLLVGTSSGGRVAVECAAHHPNLAGGLVLDSTLFESELDESLEVFERRGGPMAREAAARFLGGDRGPEALAAWKVHAMPLYSGASDGDLAARGARAIVNREVQAHFGRGKCGPLKVTAEDLGGVTCPVLILAGQDDPMSPAAAAQRVAASVDRSDVEVQVFAGVGHGVFRQDPAAAFARLRTFIAGLSAPVA